MIQVPWSKAMFEEKSTTNKLIVKLNYYLACTKYYPNLAGLAVPTNGSLYFYVSFGMDRFIIAFDPR